MAILGRLRTNPWMVTLLSLTFVLILALSWSTAAYAHSKTPFDAQYTLLGIRDDQADVGNNSGPSRTSNGTGQESNNALLGLLPSTGGPQLWLLVLGSAAFCFSGALLVQNARNRRR